MKTVLTTAALIASLITSAGIAAATPVMDRCDDELVRCSPKTAPSTTAGGWQGGLGWQSAGGYGRHADRSWFDR
jgi:opacity protein-like surface antigen